MSIESKLWLYSGRVWMWVGPYTKLSTEKLMLLNCVVGGDSWESLGRKIKLINPLGNQPLIFIGRTDAEAEVPVLWPPDAKNWLIRKHPGAGKDWRQEQKGMAEDEMVGWHQWMRDMSLSRLWELVVDREARCAAVLQGHKVPDPIERLNNKTGPIFLSPIKVSEFSSTLPFTIEKFSNPLICGSSCFLRNVVRASHTESLQVSISLSGTWKSVLMRLGLILPLACYSF